MLKYIKYVQNVTITLCKQALYIFFVLASKFMKWEISFSYDSISLYNFKVTFLQPAMHYIYYFYTIRVWVFEILPSYVPTLLKCQYYLLQNCPNSLRSFNFSTVFARHLHAIHRVNAVYVAALYYYKWIFFGYSEFFNEFPIISYIIFKNMLKFLIKVHKFIKFDVFDLIWLTNLPKYFIIIIII